MLSDVLIQEKKRRRDPDLIGYFLHLFDDGEALEREVVEEWRDSVSPIPAADIRACFKEALEEGWIVETERQFFITQSGKEKANEVLPIGPDIG
jgi:hypothetical protein